MGGKGLLPLGVCGGMWSGLCPAVQVRVGLLPVALGRRLGEMDLGLVIVCQVLF